MMDTKAIAASTVAAFEQGQYVAPDGTIVPIAESLAACVQGSRMYDPEVLDQICQAVEQGPGSHTDTTFGVVNETTLQGCTRLVADQQLQRIGVLNFASAKNPGGGFLGGARAQEESLARSSGLVFSLRQHPAFYAFHRSQENLLYSDHMIYSPACPVVRDDVGNWLPQLYTVDFITSPAPNAGAIMNNTPALRGEIVPTLARRASKLLALAAHQQCDGLILGAWGCGVFRNDPAVVAAIFHDLVHPTGPYGHRFRHILFAVYDAAHPPQTYQTFARQFADLAGA